MVKTTELSCCCVGHGPSGSPWHAFPYGMFVNNCNVSRNRVRFWFNHFKSCACRHAVLTFQAQYYAVVTLPDFIVNNERVNEVVRSPHSLVSACATGRKEAGDTTVLTGKQYSPKSNWSAHLADLAILIVFFFFFKKDNFTDYNYTSVRSFAKYDLPPNRGNILKYRSN